MSLLYNRVSGLPPRWVALKLTCVTATYPRRQEAEIAADTVTVFIGKRQGVRGTRRMRHDAAPFNMQLVQDFLNDGGPLNDAFSRLGPRLRLPETPTDTMHERDCSNAY